MVHRFAVGFAAMLMSASTASASPGVDLVCFDREFTATIGFDEGWTAAYMTNNWGEFELRASEGQGGPNNSFAFEDSTYRLVGVLPEGEIKRGDLTVARCWQTADSQKAIATYGADRPGQWSTYDAPGLGFQTVRAAPSVFAEKLASLSQGTPVIIRENTGQFLDGFFWFRIEYGEGEQGYIWGALLCTDDENPELKASLRRCG